MIVETIIGWFFSVMSNAISLLPSIGHTIDNIPKVGFTFLKYVGVMNGYAPVNETGIALGIMISVFIGFNVVKLILIAYNLISKIIP